MAVRFFSFSVSGLKAPLGQAFEQALHSCPQKWPLYFSVGRRMPSGPYSKVAGLITSPGQAATQGRGVFAVPGSAANAAAAGANALLRSGVQLYRYLPGFVHAKMCVCDDTVCIGTVNLDFRSLYLHFEDGVLLRDTPAAADICRDMEEMMQKSEQIALKELENAAPLQRIARAILRALAPLL